MPIDNIYKKIKYKPVVLIIIDGWGLSPSWGGNAISMNNPQTMNELWRNYPKTVLKAFEIVEGGHGKVGNSEIGHASIGCGRMVDQDIVEIDRAIKNNSFFSNSNLMEIADYIKSKNPPAGPLRRIEASEAGNILHLVGMLSDGAVHSHIDHLFALLEFAKLQGIAKTAIHIITDGRDVEKNSALTFITKLENKIKELGFNKPPSNQKALIASLIGRYYAMDRDGNLDRTNIAYELQVFGRGTKVKNARQAITTSYKQGLESDENLPPYIVAQPDGIIETIKNNDAVIFFNFRSDRARQLTRYYTDKDYLKRFLFFRKYPLLEIKFATLASYRLSNSLPIKTIFPPAIIENSLAKIISNHGLSQLHIAESEKYAHVSYFFNGGIEPPFSGEKRIIIPSKKVKNPTQNPQMSVKEISSNIINALLEKKYDFVIANIANVDMIGHTGNIEAASRAIQSVDEEIKKIVETGLKANAVVIITADHGNAEQMISTKDEDLETKHTLSPVPFILVTPQNKKDLIASALTPTHGYLEQILQNNHTLADVAPTVLSLLDIPKPADMTGKSLLNELE